MTSFESTGLQNLKVVGLAVRNAFLNTRLGGAAVEGELGGDDESLLARYNMYRVL